MSTSDGSLSDMDVEVSQATQLIHAALEKSPEPPGPRERNAASVHNGDLSINSFTSSKNSGINSIRQYHFHGLAATQTDTQLDDENESDSEFTRNEGSQKGKTRMSGQTGNVKWGMPSPDSRPSSPLGISVEDNVTINRRAETPGRISKVLPLHNLITRGVADVIYSTHSFPFKKPQPPTVTFQSPIKSPMPPKPPLHVMASKEKPGPSRASRQRTNHSHSPTLSEDSFAQGDTQFEKERYLATSKKFTTPLIDLARSDDDEVLSGFSHRAETTKTTSSSRTVVHGGEHPPVILVPSTPSQSEGSDHSRDESPKKFPPALQEEDSFKKGQSSSHIMLVDSDSSKGSEYSQGFDGQEEVAEVEGLYSGMRSKRSLDVHEDTYPETQLATQIATQEEQFTAVIPSIIPQTHTSTYTHTGTRSLLSYMDPSKRGRYQHLIQTTPASPISLVPQQFLSGSSKMIIDNAETQLSTIPVHPGSAPPLVRVPSPHKLNSKPASRHISVPSSVVTKDIVPDSEPMREQVRSSALEKPVLNVDEAGPQVRNSGEAKRLSNSSEDTEDSDVLPIPKKLAHREEEEEEESANENRERKSVECRQDPGFTAGDDDDDDDEPLSARFQKGKGKTPVAPVRGKGSRHTYKSKSERNAGRHYPSTGIKQSTHRQKGRPSSKSSRTGVGDTSHESAVPSSVPDQDHPPVRSRKPSLKAVVAIKEKASKAPGKASRATSSSRSAHSATVEADGIRDIDMEAVSDSESATEIAMDEANEEEAEEYMDPGSTQQNLKRKRGQPPKSKSMNQALTTPRTRLTKRLKSVVSTITKVGATRVFALWKQNKHWYSGTVYEHVSDNTYMIKFDDDSETVVSTEQMRTNNLRVGDLVRFGKRNKDCKVTRVDHRSNTVIIDFEGEPDELEFKEISISMKVINSTWQDRLVNPRAVVAAVRDIDVKINPTPSPSRSTASFLSLNTNTRGPRQSYKFLQKVGLIVSLGSNTNDRTEDGKSRSDILCAVRDSGGVVVDDLFKYLKMDIMFSTHHWVIERDSVRWVGEPKELQRLFLLADSYNLKPKYLMALALGIPCLSIRWLYACLEACKELDWRPYLLPQGRPTVLESVLPSQQIDLSWGERPEHLFNIMENPLTSRLLEGQSVLCAGPDMTPRGKDVDKASFIIRIILAMGAKRVEAVRDITHAMNPLSQYDLLILRERDQYTRDCVQTHTVDWNWIKDSLIMSRRLTYPIWSIDEDSQCSQNL